MNCRYLTSSLVCLLTAEVTLWLAENKGVREGHATQSHESSSKFLWNVDISKHCSASSCFCGWFFWVFFLGGEGYFYGSFFYPTTQHLHSLSNVKLQFQSCTDIHKYSCNLKTEVDFVKGATSLLSLIRPLPRSSLYPWFTGKTIS